MASRIARAISKKRQESPIATTTQLAAIVASCMPAERDGAKFIPRPERSRRSELP